jgi:hypothetical protein
MWFDNIMDDCKKGLKVAGDHKGIFIPILVNAGIHILFFILLFIVLMTYFIAHGRDLGNIADSPGNYMGMIITLIIGGLISYLILTILGCLLESGTVQLYKLAVEGIQPRASWFIDGAKRHFIRILGGTLIFHIITFVLLIPILVIMVLYTFTVGILTAGWGLILVGVIYGVYFNAWTIAVAVDNKGPIEAIGASMRLGKRYFRGLFVLTLAGIMISQFLTSAFGPLVAFVGGWFISGVVLAFLKLVVLLVYKRSKEKFTKESIESI